MIELRGVIPPLVTPVGADGGLDEGTLKRLVDRAIEAGVAGLFVAGSSGEGPWLSGATLRKLVSCAKEYANERVPLLVGVLEPSTERVLSLADDVVSAGADALVIATPYYFTCDERTQAHHFERIADASPVPIVLYNIPQMTHNPVSAATVEKVMGHPNIIGLKDSEGDLAKFQDFLELSRGDKTFRTLQGSETQAAAALKLGADGLVPGLGNIVPGHFTAMYRASERGAHDACERLQADIDKLWQLHTHGYWLSCLKYASSIVGGGTGQTLGRPSLPDDARTAIEKLVTQVSAPISA